jgi:hypothetical protein
MRNRLDETRIGIVQDFDTLSFLERRMNAQQRQEEPGGRIPGRRLHMNEFECVIPILNVKNFAASMDYSA